MHKIGDNILYGASGVMTVVDIREESIGDVSRKYCVLRPALIRSDSLTFVPMDNEKLVSFMRPLLTKEEAIDLIHNASDISPLEWIGENRARSDAFKKIMESGDRVKMLAMIRAIDENAKRREAEGKKSFLADENAKSKAEKLLLSELSLVLGVSEEDILVILKS